MQCNMAREGGDFPKAEACYSDALDKAPDDAKLHEGFGLTYFSQGKFASAAAEYGKALELGTGNPETVFYLGLSLIGKSDVKAGQAAIARFDPPFKYYMRQAVLEELERQRSNPPASAGESILRFQDALDKGMEQQEVVDAEARRWRVCPYCP